MIQLYTAPTPNGWKASTTLEELGFSYTVHSVSLSKNEQKSPEFLAINPNGRIPAIVDDGFAVFESGAIMLYLAEKAGKLPSDPKQRSVITQWLMFQMGGLGPMMGQANVFLRYFPEKIPAAITRYQKESLRLLTVLNARLAHNEWLAGELSIADLANGCWARTHRWAGVSIDGLEHLQRWLDQLHARPAFQRGLDVPVRIPDIEGDPEAEKAFIKQARKIVTT